MKNEHIIAKIAAGATLATAAAGIYFFYGSKNAEKNQKMVKSWMIQIKGEIMERLENMPEANQEMYNKIVKEVTSKYQTLKKINETEVAEFVEELKGHWKNIKKDLDMSNKKSKK